MKYSPTHSATALRPFSRALSCGKKIHCRARAGAGWWKYSSHSRNTTAAALATTMPPSAARSAVGDPGRTFALRVARSGTVPDTAQLWITKHAAAITVEGIDQNDGC